MQIIVQNIKKLMDTAFPNKDDVEKDLSLKAKTNHTHHEYCDASTYKDIQMNFANKLGVINDE